MVETFRQYKDSSSETCTIECPITYLLDGRRKIDASHLCAVVEGMLTDARDGVALYSSRNSYLHIDSTFVGIVVSVDGRCIFTTIHFAGLVVLADDAEVNDNVLGRHRHHVVVDDLMELPPVDACRI